MTANIPDSAVEAAAEALREAWPADFSARLLARAALAAALPILREELAKEIVKWLVEVVHYPFDMHWETPPPIDHDLIAAYWNEWDGWRITDEEARDMIRDESGT